MLPSPPPIPPCPPGPNASLSQRQKYIDDMKRHKELLRKLDNDNNWVLSILIAFLIVVFACVAVLMWQLAGVWPFLALAGFGVLVWQVKKALFP